MKKLKLENKSVLITGADSGIGKAVALLFAEEGADVAIIYHSDEENARKTKSEIQDLGRKSVIFQGDVSDSGFCKEVTEKVASEFGGIDILINNAGTQFPSKNIEDLEEENIRTTFNSNIIGMILSDKSRLSLSETGEFCYQYHFRCRLSGPSGTAGLFRHQGRYCFFHAFTGPAGKTERDPC